MGNKPNEKPRSRQWRNYAISLKETNASNKKAVPPMTADTAYY